MKTAIGGIRRERAGAGHLLCHLGSAVPRDSDKLTDRIFRRPAESAALTRNFLAVWGVANPAAWTGCLVSAPPHGKPHPGDLRRAGVIAAWVDLLLALVAGGLALAPMPRGEAAPGAA
jgi:hypothetical protein